MKYLYLMIIFFIIFCEILTSPDKWYNDPERNTILQKILKSFGLDGPIYLDIPTEDLSSITKNIKNIINVDNNDNRIKKYLQIEPSSYNHPLITFKSFDLIKNSINIKSLYLKIDYVFLDNFEEPLKVKIFLLLNNNDNNEEEEEDVGNFIFKHNKNINSKKIFTLQVPLNLTIFNHAIPNIKDEIKLLIKFEETILPTIIQIENVYLEAVVLDSNDRIKRHSDKNCQNEKGEKLCCIKKSNINFEEIGWNFIVSPKILQAQFCQGDCYHPDNNMLLSNVLSKFKHLQDIEHKSCCYPTEYIPLNVSIFKSGLTIETRTLNNLMAKKCSCY
uniref:Transforming growth factor beta-like protein 1 n=1 Tax=Strongyloides stercoralis TaxID=6248 RepID=Q4VRV7_STRER|nr:transforming growth factor beta-like protein 1 precursor [Strongyloides stercoralis]